MTHDFTIGAYRLGATTATSAAGHEHTAVAVDSGEHVLLTVLESLSAIDGRDGQPDAALQADYQALIRRLSALSYPLLGMPIASSPADSERYWYVSAPTDGTPLRRHLDHRGRFGWRAVALILHEACVTLGFAHRHGLAHGNLNPETVLVEPGGSLRLVRPDVAGRLVFTRDESATVSLDALWDEPVYLSPDVLNRRAPEPADDLYALGVLAFELLTAQLPYVSASEPLRRAQSRRTAPDPGALVPSLPEPMTRLVRTLMAPRAAVRVSDVESLRDELQRLLPEVRPADSRAALVVAMRERITSGRSRDAGVPVPRSPQAVAPGREDAEAQINAALLAAGMTSGARAARDDRTPRRGVWVALGALMVLVGVGVSSMPRDRATPEVTPRPQASEVVPDSVPLAEGVSAGLVPEGVTIVEAPSPPDDPMEVARLKAEALLTSGQQELAVRILKAAMADGADAQGALGMLLGRALADLGKTDEAVAAYRAADGRERIAGHMLAGIQLAVAGRCPEAIHLFVEAAARKPPSAEVFKHIGNCQLIIGDDEVAAATLRKGAQLAPEDLDLLVPLGQALEKLNDMAGAKQAFRRALAVAPSDRRAREGLKRIGLVDAALRPELVNPDQDVADAEPVDPKVLEVAAHAAFKAGDYALAVRHYQEVAELLGEDAPPSVLRNLAVALHKAGRARAALRAYAAAMAVNPEDLELHYLAGTLMASERRYGDAARALKTVVSRDPEHWKARFDYGLVTLAQGKHEEAVRAFEAITRQRPQDRSAWQNLVKARLDAGDKEGALSALAGMHDAHPRDAKTLMSMVTLLQSLNRDDEAQALLLDACSKGIQDACP